MKAYLGIKYHADHSNKDKIDSLSSIIEKFGYSVTCIDRDIEEWGRIPFAPNELMGKTFEIINESDLVIIDLSEKGVGLGIEAGYAYSKGIPVIAIGNKTEISTTLIGISKHHYVYNNFEELTYFFSSVLGRT
jgi:2'-deoxynucleoside 5'-phosphate N-hydrolase